MFDYEIATIETGRKRSNSLSESATSADESCNSVGDEISSSSLSGTSTPITSAHDYSSSGYDESKGNRSAAPFNTYPLKVFEVAAKADSHLANELDPMSLPYIPADSLALQPTMHYPIRMPTMLEALRLQQSLCYLTKSPPIDQMRAAYEPHLTIPNYPIMASAEYEQSTKMAAIASPPKKTGFSISAILGCESWDTVFRTLFLVSVALQVHTYTLASSLRLFSRRFRAIGQYTHNIEIKIWLI